ncbi:MAG: DNA polymerase III subunit delta' [Bacteroidetes bacterium]|nr:MAG: DNA polymerase III subunit delta' [Bacteroidota bacterium]
MLFKDIIGHLEVKKRLVRSVQENRVSHAQLFLGAEGSGALALAVAYTQYILCKTRRGGDACGMCASCTKIGKLVHPDVHFVYPIAIKKHESEKSTDVVTEWRESFLQNPYLNLSDWFSHLDAENKQPIIGVEESGEILRKLSLTTYEGEFKVMIIWMPEKMNIAAANKLLKILEEPPDKTLFILVSENEDALLRTIYSRTQLIKVNRIADEDIKKILIEKSQLSAADAARIAYLADGNYNAALKLIGENQKENLHLQKFREWMRRVFKADVVGIISWAEEIANVKVGRENQKAFLLYGLNIIRECLAGMYGDKKLLRVDGEELDFVQKLSTRLDGNLCKGLSDELNEAIIHIERNGSGKLIFTDLSLKCMRIVKQVQKV